MIGTLWFLALVVYVAMILVATQPTDWHRQHENREHYRRENRVVGIGVGIILWLLASAMALIVSA